MRYVYSGASWNIVVPCGLEWSCGVWWNARWSLRLQGFKICSSFLATDSMLLFRVVCTLCIKKNCWVPNKKSILEISYHLKKRSATNIDSSSVFGVCRIRYKETIEAWLSFKTPTQTMINLKYIGKQPENDSLSEKFERGKKESGISLKFTQIFILDHVISPVQDFIGYW